MLIGIYLRAGLGEALDASSAEVMMPSHPFSEAVLNCGQAQTADIIEAAASELECTRLRLRADERVYRIRRRRNRGGRVFLIEDVTLPATLFPGLADRGVIADHIGVLAQEYGI